MLSGGVVHEGPVRTSQRRAQGQERQALGKRLQDEDEGSPRGEALEHGRGHLPNAYIGGDARSAGKSTKPQPLSAAGMSFGRQAKGIALAWPGRKDSPPMLKKASAYRIGVGRSASKGSSLGGAVRNRARRQKSADRSAVPMPKSECAWCCRVKRGLVGARPKRP